MHPGPNSLGALCLAFINAKAAEFDASVVGSIGSTKVGVRSHSSSAAIAVWTNSSERPIDLNSRTSQHQALHRDLRAGVTAEIPMGWDIGRGIGHRSGTLLELNDPSRHGR
jgi:hypothetical protein